jgi:MtN3 and saliva related transmembrane protein
MFRLTFKATMTAENLGFIAGTITTISFVPQVIRVYRNKSGRDVSAWMMLLLATGTLLWLIYGIMVGGVPIIAANAVTFTLVVVIFILKLYYARDR